MPFMRISHPRMRQTSRVRLVRSPLRLAVVVGLRAAVGLVAVTTGLGAPGTLGAALLVAGAAILVYAAGMTLFFATVRVELDRSEIHVVWALSRRRYQLRRGPVTRMAPRKRRLIDAQIRFPGLMLGRATVADERLAGILALGSTEHLIAIPTAEGRLALGIESEDELLAALGS
jgi:hypothetical protein